MLTLEVNFIGGFDSGGRIGQNERRFDAFPRLRGEGLLYYKRLIGQQMLAQWERRSDDPRFPGFTPREYLESPFLFMYVDPLGALVGGRLFRKQFARPGREDQRLADQELFDP